MGSAKFSIVRPLERGSLQIDREFQAAVSRFVACFLLLAPGFVRSVDRSCDRSEMDGSGGHQLPLEWPHPGPYGYDPYTNTFLPLPYYGYGFGVEYSWNPPDLQQGPIPAPYSSSSVPLGASFFILNEKELYFFPFFARSYISSLCKQWRTQDLTPG